MEIIQSRLLDPLQQKRCIDQMQNRALESLRVSHVAIISFLNISVESRIQYKINSGLLPIERISLYSPNCGTIISPRKSTILDSGSNNLAPILCRNTLSRMRN